MSAKALGVGLIGCGTVGSGVVKLLVEQADLYAERMGRPIVLRKVLCRPETPAEKTAQVPDGARIHDADVFLADDQIDVVIELVGGTDFALDIVRRSLKAGKHVVTANKALLAAHGNELFALARQNGVSIAFEGSCAGGIPVISAMQFSLIANEITALYGILNGTCNYILTQMLEAGKSYDTALAEAKAAGFAEADPTLDVNGGDTAHKLAILASMAFGVSVTDDQIAKQGIDTLDLADVNFGAELGYQIKLLATAERTDAGVALGVAPCFIDRHEQLALVSGSFNALSIYGNAVGHTLFYGRGAGQMPTASAVVGDLLSIADGAYPAAFANLKLWADQHPTYQPIDDAQLTSRYYIRLNVLDVPGVTAQYTAILGEENVSIAAVIQHESFDDGGTVPVVVVTHKTQHGALRRAAERIAELDPVDREPVCIRIIDMPSG